MTGIVSENAIPTIIPATPPFNAYWPLDVFDAFEQSYTAAVSFVLSEIKRRNPSESGWIPATRQMSVSSGVLFAIGVADNLVVARRPVLIELNFL
jgi:hypothetical protein